MAFPLPLTARARVFIIAHRSVFWPAISGGAVVRRISRCVLITSSPRRRSLTNREPRAWLPGDPSRILSESSCRWNPAGRLAIAFRGFPTCPQARKATLCQGPRGGPVGINRMRAAKLGLSWRRGKRVGHVELRLPRRKRSHAFVLVIGDDRRVSAGLRIPMD
jgi:hypothetical protein